MRVAIDAVNETGALCEGAICYTSDLFDRSRPKYDLRYYLGIAHELQRAGVQVIGVKDMAGVCRPRAARELVAALKREIGLPVHFHTHDTSGASAASVLAAIEAGPDDGAGHGDAPETGERRGLGVRNVADRIRIRYGDRYGLFICSEPGRGTVIKIVVPKTAGGVEREAESPAR